MDETDRGKMAGEQLGCIVADTDEEYRSFVAAAAQREGLRVISVGSEQSAIEAAERSEIAIVLISVDLSGNTGCELCREIRRIYYQRPLQIVLMSRSWSHEVVAPAMEAGADDVMKNPSDELELELRIRAARFRYQSQAQIHHEREFFREAAKQEEELSSRVLDQNINLKRAYQNIEIVNQQLERSNRELQRVARYDVLSGLMNRMSLFTMIDVEIDRSLRTGSRLCGIMLDIDHFKTVNDEHGHQCGDSFIRMIGQTLKNELRKYDHVGRYGGEEFFVLLPNTSLQQARKFGDRVRMALEEQRISCEELEISITASLGIAQYRPGESREMWISRADRAMYVAKQNGRNRVEVESLIAY
jgi:diguanylate cyclase (GGDEF)-like protein